MTTKIYLWCVPMGTGRGVVNGSTVGGDVMGYAMTEQGVGLASHLSSSEAFSKHDIGLTSDWHHDSYAEACPDGYEVEWVDDLDGHEGFLKALSINRVNHIEKNPAP